MENKKIKETLIASAKAFNGIIIKVKIFRMRREKGLLTKYNMDELMNNIESLCIEKKEYLLEILKQLENEQNNQKYITTVENVHY